MKFRHAGYKVVIVPMAYYAHLPPNTLKKLVLQFFRNGRLSAYCNKFFPEFAIETPAGHTNSFVEKRAFYYRTGRHAIKFIWRVGKGHWIYICALSAYAFGFLFGYCAKREAKSK
jgi:hypothetical protein